MCQIPTIMLSASKSHVECWRKNCYFCLPSRNSNRHRLVVESREEAYLLLWPKTADRSFPAPTTRDGKCHMTHLSIQCNDRYMTCIRILWQSQKCIKLHKVGITWTNHPKTAYLKEVMHVLSYACIAYYLNMYCIILYQRLYYCNLPSLPTTPNGRSYQKSC